MVTLSIPNSSVVWTKQACDALSGNHDTIQETALSSQNPTYKFTLRTQQGIYYM